MFYICVAIFNMMKNLKKFLILGETCYGEGSLHISAPTPMEVHHKDISTSAVGRQFVD